MCIFQDSDEVWTKTLKKKDAVESYKGIAIGGPSWSAAPYFRSPMRGTRATWNGRFLKSECHGAQRPLFGMMAKEGVWSPGIHCLTSLSAGKRYSDVVVRVKMWGKVIKYRKQKRPVGATWGENGYLAENVEIVEIVWVSPNAWNAGKVEAIENRYRALKKNKTKK